ncbi:hypothetical protein AWW66_09945 [Micromonospora rosaria]|uniref:Uncharacterized protein n=1 Tax=Micromonospora rosaria TaxID=47874 RepID=A0A136PUH4_9ACTN|nr:hypothetical protein AWW66_09945 [Micromonospora rosaria]
MVHVVDVGALDTSIFHVNRDMVAFKRCIEALTDAFPFYGEGEIGDVEASFTQWQEAGFRVAGILISVDPSSLDPSVLESADFLSEGDTFWQDFLESVKMGDCSTEQILEDE